MYIKNIFDIIKYQACLAYWESENPRYKSY